MNKKMNKFKKIKLIVTDFDGVMTDNKVLVNENGIESVFCNRSDGMAVELLEKKEIKIVVISKEMNNSIGFDEANTWNLWYSFGEVGDVIKL